MASSIAEALRQARALRPDLILVDIGLGRESGFDLAWFLARDDQGADVILISAGAEADYADLIAESPAAGFLAKSELSARRIGQILSPGLLGPDPPAAGTFPRVSSYRLGPQPSMSAGARYR
jgi:DNA-binding NarL/FixJ family response regulator